MVDAAEFERFGRDFLRLVLRKERILESVARALGPTLELGPIPAGPGRRFAKATARGAYGGLYGDELPGDSPAFKVFVPVDVEVEVDVAGATLKFQADVVAPIVLTMELESPITVQWRVTPPTEDDVQLELRSTQRASSIIQKVAGLDADLRAFMMRFVTREMQKPHIQRALRIDLVPIIDGAWPALADQFLPTSDADRQAPPPEEAEIHEVP